MKKYLLLLAPLIGIMIGWLMALVSMNYGMGYQTFVACILFGAVVWCLVEIVFEVRREVL